MSQKQLAALVSAVVLGPLVAFGVFFLYDQHQKSDLAEYHEARENFIGWLNVERRARSRGDAYVPSSQASSESVAARNRLTELSKKLGLPGPEDAEAQARPE